MDLEQKSLEFEIKEIKEDGTFEGLASPYNNIDFGGDRVLPTIGKRNNNKSAPYLWQHNTHEQIGQIDMKTTDKGIIISGKLYLDTNDKGIPLIPNAQKAYVLMKNKQLKNSIGYKTIDFEYVTEGKQTIRNLKDIEIMEVSAVTFPMNPEATISNVKSQGGETVEEEKAMSFANILKIQDVQDMRWKLQDALNQSLRVLINDEALTVDQKVAQLNTNVDDFAKAYKSNMTDIIKATSKSKTAKKSFLDNFETKDSKIESEVETEATEPTEPMEPAPSEQEETKDDIIKLEMKAFSDALMGITKELKGDEDVEKK